MRTTLIILGLLLPVSVSCAPPPIFTSKCGMGFFGVTDGSDIPEYWNLQNYQHAEDRAVAEFKTVTGNPRFQNGCQYLNGYALYIYPTESVPFPEDPRYVLFGESDCRGGWVYVGNVPPQDGALSHELAHIVEGCKTKNHEGWNENGLNAAIERAQEG